MIDSLMRVWGADIDAAHSRPLWPDGTPKSLHTVFNWRKSAPSASSATLSAAQQRKAEKKQKTSS